MEAGLVKIEQVHRGLPARNKERGPGDESRGSAGRDPPGLSLAYASSPRLSTSDEAAFGHYRTRAPILACMNAPAAGDTETPLAV